MIFYHYTTAHGATRIMKMALLDVSKADPLQPGWVSLTTDPDCSGHGVHDGRPVPLHSVKHVDHYLVDGVALTFDHTEWRAVLNLDPLDAELVKATLHHNVTMLTGLEVAAFHPGNHDVDGPTAVETYLKLQFGSLVSKSHSGWYYKKPIPASMILHFERRNAQGNFVQEPL